MLNATAVTAQIVTPNNNILFPSNRLITGCGIRHDAGSGQFTITKPGLYRVSFMCNVDAAAAQQIVNLAIVQNGEPIQSANAMATITAINDLLPVYISAPILINCNCCTTIAISNESTVDTTVENASIIIERVG